MPQAQGAEGRLYLTDELTFKTVPELLVEDCEDAWNEGTVANVTASLDTSDKKVGSGSAKFVVAVGFTTGLIGYETISIASLASYERLTAWVKSSVALDAGDMKLELDNTALCASPLESTNIPALAADTWTQISLTLANPATDLTLISIGLRMAVDKGALNFWIDDIRAIKGGIYLPFISEGLRLSRSFNQSSVIRSTRNPNQPARGRQEVGGDITTELNPYMGRIFHHALGSWTRSGVSSPYTHTFKIGSLPTGLMVEKQFPDILQYLRYNGCKINSIGLKCGTDGPLEFRIGLMGAKEAVSALAFEGQPTDFGHTPFDAFEAVINQGGAPLGIVTALDFTLENGLDGSVFVIDATGERYSLPSGIVKVSGQVTALFETMTLYNLALNHTETSLSLVLTKGAGDGTVGDEKITFAFDEIVFTPNAPVIQGPTGILVELPFEAYYSDDADASALQVTLLNAQANL